MLNDMYLKSAARYLPMEIQAALERIPAGEQPRCEEVRLRAGRALSVSIGGKERVLSPPFMVERQQLSRLVETATRSSAYLAQDTMKEGYITLEGGHRLGLCGRLSLKNGEPSSLGEISSASIRIAREISGVGSQIIGPLTEGGFKSTLLLSPPGLGKTTLLRDLIRLLYGEGLRVGVADERGELAGTYGGEAQFDLGRMTDIVDRAPKSAGILMLLKNMSPQIIAVDEITSPEDIAAMRTAAYCGVELLASAHAEDIADLSVRPLYRSLMELNIFRRAVVIGSEDGRRQYTVKEI